LDDFDAELKSKVKNAPAEYLPMVFLLLQAILLLKVICLFGGNIG
jgi:hypothetical protein